MQFITDAQNSRAPRHVEQEFRFQVRHPELADFLAEIEGTFARCQLSPCADLELAWRHISHDCAWCAEEFEELRKVKASVLAG
jgi:hypothetical protein